MRHSHVNPNYAACHLLSTLSVAGSGRVSHFGRTGVSESDLQYFMMCDSRASHQINVVGGGMGSSGAPPSVERCVGLGVVIRD